MQSHPVQSHSVIIKPVDSRCRYWAKVVRATTTLPFPAQVFGAENVPGPYLYRGEEELLPGDALLEGEANHHRRTDCGWSYWLTAVTLDGRLHRYTSGFSAQKAQMKAQGFTPELLKGSGDIAAMVRIIFALRAGLEIMPTEFDSENVTLSLVKA